MPVSGHIYDALNIYHLKAQMNKYNAQLEVEDIVLIMDVVHWPIRQNNKDKDNKRHFSTKTLWKTWNIEFNLNTIFILYSGNGYAETSIRQDELFEG